MKHIEVLKLALEALEEIHPGNMTPMAEGSWNKAITAIREALAEQPAQQQEPVAWMDGYRNIYSLEEKAAGCPEATIALVPMANHKKTSGSPINELQCVCGAVWLGDEMVHLPNKRPPASKPWVGLTQQDIDIAFDDTQEGGGFNEFARAIEAKLKEKNNG